MVKPAVRASTIVSWPLLISHPMPPESFVPFFYTHNFLSLLELFCFRTADPTPCGNLQEWPCLHLFALSSFAEPPVHSPSSPRSHHSHPPELCLQAPRLGPSPVAFMRPPIGPAPLPLFSTCLKPLADCSGKLLWAWWHPTQNAIALLPKHMIAPSNLQHLRPPLPRLRISNLSSFRTMVSQHYRSLAPLSK